MRSYTHEIEWSSKGRNFVLKVVKPPRIKMTHKRILDFIASRHRFAPEDIVIHSVKELK